MEPVVSGRKEHYGSIGIPDEVVIGGLDGQEEAIPENPQKPSLPWIFGSILLLSGLVAIYLRPEAKSAIPVPKSIIDNVEILGKVHRSPADTPHAFSQRVDHLDPHNHETFQQRYYRKSEFFKGPGHPIILIVGGEGALDDGMFYPFIDTYLAERFGAYVLHPGESMAHGEVCVEPSFHF